MTQTAGYCWGPQVEAQGTRFRLWAPAQPRVVLELGDGTCMDMRAGNHGWHEVATHAPPGTTYRFRIGDTSFPDPASRAQSGDVHGWSVVTVPTHEPMEWRGRPWQEAVIYEMHVGLAGGFRAAAEQLGSLAELGVTAIELMPIADFPGARNWGYDGVLPFAPDEAYGSPPDLAFLIHSAHTHGIMVLLDVVYNHFGPDGNYLSLHAPQFFRGDCPTPWGDAIDFRQLPVRRFFIENALYWINDVGFDGLRLDAVHAIQDREFLGELAAAVRDSVAADRHVHLVLENENNDASLLGQFDAQWNDDIHHALHVMLTGERDGYYEDFAASPANDLARALREGFVYQGQHSKHRGAPRGSPSAQLATTSFINCLQNHDQVGNRAFGERLTSLADAWAVKAAAELLMLCPHIPMVFMGEEVGASQPFLYFTDHRNTQLANAVREGRRTEFAKFPAFANARTRERIPDPNAASTFEMSKPQADNAYACQWRALYRNLIAARRTHIVPHLANAHGDVSHVISPSAVMARWTLNDGSRLTLAANLGADPVQASLLPKTVPFWGTCNGSLLAPFTTLAWIER
ncbi:MAG: malto-oligosyltrehalose trehalohydrolase [Gemmatimonadetes bacterium]|nr:malto-oligosyltrehalose trehalohydrolase [Gemmatimonadota bacterium]